MRRGRQRWTFLAPASGSARAESPSGVEDGSAGAGEPEKDAAPMNAPMNPATAGLQAMLQVEPSAWDAKL